MMAVEDVEKDAVPLSAQGLWTRRGQLRPTPMPSTSDLSRALEAVDHTLSEVLVLLYEVVHANQVLVDFLRREAAYGQTRAPGVAPEQGRQRPMSNNEANTPGAGTTSTIRPMPTTEDLARSIQALDTTLSEVLVLLYHVVQANHSLVETLRDQRSAPPPAPPRLTGARPVLYAISDRSTGQ